MGPTINIQKILCPVDFSICSKHALEYALAFASQYGAEIRLIHAVESPATAFAYVDLEIPEPDLINNFREQAEKQLDKLTEDIRKRHERVTSELCFGKPYAEIINAAGEWPTDMIIMGTHGRAGLEHALIGSVAEKVVRKATCPVLTVRHPEHEFVHI